MNNQKGNLATVLVVMITAVFLLGVGCSSINTRHVGHGVRNGNVVKLASEGFYNKTNEVEIIRGGMNAGSGSFGVKPFYATVTNPADLEKLQKAFDEQKEVVITYDSYFWTPFASGCGGEGENCSFVSSVEVK